MSFKNFGYLFSCALFGAIIYEGIVYISDPYTPNWSNLGMEILAVSLIVSIVLMVTKDIIGRDQSSDH